jgi:hypothetical protein
VSEQQRSRSGPRACKRGFGAGMTSANYNYVKTFSHLGLERCVSAPFSHGFSVTDTRFTWNVAGAPRETLLADAKAAEYFTE